MAVAARTAVIVNALVIVPFLVLVVPAVVAIPLEHRWDCILRAGNLVDLRLELRKLPLEIADAAILAGVAQLIHAGQSSADRLLFAATADSQINLRARARVW